MLAFGLRFSIAVLNKKHIDVHNMIKENARKELKKAYSVEKEDIDFKSNESDPSSRSGNYLSSFFPSFLPQVVGMETTFLPSFPPSFLLPLTTVVFDSVVGTTIPGTILVIVQLYVHPNYLTFCVCF
jgi:hypothetical protein